MPSIVFCFLFLFVSNYFIEPAVCNLPNYIQNLEFDDIASLWDKFPSIIGKIKEAVKRFRCPKGWRRLGGSCYYLPDTTSIPLEANYTCNQVHSNHSNLMQIRNTMELFYAAHVLAKYNLSEVMIDIDQNLLRGKTLSDIFMTNHDRWKRMKEKFRQVRLKYHKLKDKIRKELSAVGIRISSRSESFRKRKQKLIEDPSQAGIDDENDYSGQYNETNEMISYDEQDEYEDINSKDDADDFENVDDLHGICDQIDWNPINNDSTVYILTSYLISDRVICALTNPEPDRSYSHVCEYVLDFCFANVVCGKHGRCVNTLSGFKCSCSFLYGGILCERISKQGQQIIIGSIIIAILYGLSMKPIRYLMWRIWECMLRIRKTLKTRTAAKKSKNSKTKNEKQKLVETNETNQNKNTNTTNKNPTEARRLTIAEEIIEILFPKPTEPLRCPAKRDLGRVFWVGGLSILILALLYSITTFTHFRSFKYDITDETKLELLVNDTIRLVSRCEKIADYRLGNLIFFPVAICLIFMFSWSVKRERKCPQLCDGRPGLIPPIEPFRSTNRFTTATVFGILAFEVLKIFEELLFSTGNPLNHGVLFEVFERVAVVILVGLRYYPVLASLQLQNVVSRFFACIYILADIVYAIIREGSCMGFLPVSKYYTAIEEAKLRMELGTWFIIYGLIKNTPHFILLSYIGAELCVRFAYDSVYVRIKKKQSIWSAPVVQREEYDFAKYHVQKLFRRRYYTYNKYYSKGTNISELDDYVHESEQMEKQLRVKIFLNKLYPWDDSFRFTTIATCTYAVAVVFLYYLACLFVFLYISRIKGHVSFLKYYIESSLNIEIQGLFSLRLEIIISAIAAALIYGGQLYVAMLSYKKHKLDLYRGIYEDIPSSANFKPNAIASKSVHYSGFVVGYMAWGFVICFHLIFFVLTLIRVVSLQIRYIELVFAIVVPVLVVYLLKMLATSSAGSFLFIKSAHDKLSLENRKTYAIFVYFNFFADCFLGIASCIIRLIKATFLNVVYMARLDCSFLGRPLEKFDLGFAAYVSYLHMEVAHTHPVALAFCYSLYEDVISRRPRQCYEDECCIASAEMTDEELICEQHCREQRKNKTKKKNSNGNGSSKKKTTTTTTTKKKKKNESDQNEISTTKHMENKNQANETNDQNKNNTSSVRDHQTAKTKSSSSSPSVNSGKSGSHISKQRKLSIDDDEKEENEDGGPKTPSYSTVARLVPEKNPTLPPLSPVAPERADLQHSYRSDDDEDEDGGKKVPTISTISKIMPQKKPQLPLAQGTSAPPVPKRKDINSDGDEDDDGGIDPKAIFERKRANEEKRKKKEEERKRRQSQAHIDEDDEDGGLSIIKLNEEKKKKKTNKPVIRDTRYLDDDDEDGGISKQKQIEAEKKKKALDEKKRRKDAMEAIRNQDNDEDDDGAPKQSAQAEKKKPKPKPTKINIPKDEDEDEDGGLSIKNYDTIQKMMPRQKPVLNNQLKKMSQSPTAQDDGSMLASRTLPSPTVATYNIVGQMGPTMPLSIISTQTENHYDTIPTEEERLARVNAIYSPPSYDQASISSRLTLLRTTSYREAQQSTPPLSQQKRMGSSSSHSQSNANDDSSHYSEITTTNMVRSGTINRSYSNTGSIKSSSNHSVKQYSKQSSGERLIEATEESTVEEEEEEEESDSNTEESEQEEKHVRIITPTSKENGKYVSSAFPTLSHLVNREKAEERQIIQRRRRARFRWYLAYTILNNYHLFDLRKHVQSRLAMLYIQRSLGNEEKQNLPENASATTIAKKESSDVRRIKPTTSIEVIPPTPETNRSNDNYMRPARIDYPQSPAEQYVKARCTLLYDPALAIDGVVRSATSSTIGPSGTGGPAGPAGSPGSRPMDKLSTTSAPSMTLKKLRPILERQESRESTPLNITRLSNTPEFRAVDDTNDSIADYPLANGSSATNFTVLNPPTSHFQQMEAWKHNVAKQRRKDTPNRYFYGPAPPQTLDWKISNAIMITPEFRNPTGKYQRLPSRPAFDFPTNPNVVNEKISSPTVPPERPINKLNRSNEKNGNDRIHVKDPSIDTATSTNV